MQKKKDIADYVSDLGPVRITMDAHIKNPNAEYWNINDTLNKIVDIMKEKRPVHLRIGKSIYENCIISKLTPEFTNIYDLKFEIIFHYNYVFNARATKTPQKTFILNNTEIYTEEVYGGIITGTKKEDNNNKSETKQSD